MPPSILDTIWTRIRRVFCAELHVSVVMTPSVSFLMSILSTSGISASRSGRSGNSRAVTSFHLFNLCFKLSSLDGRMNVSLGTKILNQYIVPNELTISTID